MNLSTMYEYVKTMIMVAVPTGYEVYEQTQTRVTIPCFCVGIAINDETYMTYEVVRKEYTITIDLVTGITQDADFDRKSIEPLETLRAYIHENGIADVIENQGLRLSGITEREKMADSIVYGFDVNFFRTEERATS